MSVALVKFDAAKRALAEARSIDKVKDIRDKAEALRLYIRQQGEGLEMQNDIAEIKIRAERRAGELLAEMEKAKGGGDTSTGSRVEPVQEPPTLAQIGVTKQQSHRWQRAAHIPEEVFEQHVTEVKSANDKELTSAGVQRLAKKLEQQEREQNNKAVNAKVIANGDSLIIIGDARAIDLSQFPHRYQVIVADPPWHYRVSKGQGVTKDQYETLTVSELEDMPVDELADDNCALFLWGTWPKLPEALQVMWAWGFEYVTGFPWVKLKGDKPFYGVGYWVRGCSEYILIGKKGSVSPPRLSGFLGLLSPGLKHSRKPDSVHEVAEALSGPYLELFARRSRPGWTVFGNEIQEAFA